MILSFPGLVFKFHSEMDTPHKCQTCAESLVSECSECRCTADGCRKKWIHFPYKLCEEHTLRCSRPGCTEIAVICDEETRRLRICYAHMFPCENPGGCELGKARFTSRGLCFYHDPKIEKCSATLSDGRRCPEFDYTLRRCPIHDPVPRTKTKRPRTRVPGRGPGQPRKEPKIPPPEPVVYKPATQEQVNKITMDLMDDIMNGKFTHETYEKHMYGR